jgi:hypothetical protein
MSNDIDRVARALCAKKLWPGAFDQEVDGNRDEWRLLARAAIEAIWEPTAEMLSAAAPFPLALVLERDSPEYTKQMETATLADRLAARSIYQTMLSEILK